MQLHKAVAPPVAAHVELGTVRGAKQSDDTLHEPHPPDVIAVAGSPLALVADPFILLQRKYITPLPINVAA